MKIVFRGDLNSNNGYSKAIRAYANLCCHLGDVEGIPIHQGNSTDARWDYPLCDDGDLYLGSLFPSPEKLLVIQVCTPDLYIRYPGAINVGCFFWESLTLPLSFEWVSGFSSVDWLWLPASYMHEMPLLKSFENKIVMPWPIMFSKETKAQRGDAGLDSLISIGLQGVHRKSTALEVRRKFSKIYLSVSSIAARKGVPGLIRAWLASAVDGALVLRLSLKHFSLPISDLQDYLFQVGLDGREMKRVFFILNDLPDESMRELFALSDFYVTNTFGEGFGGPVAEAILHGLPVISAIHSGLQDLLAEDHALRVPHKSSQINLLGNLDVYSPSTEWCVPDAVALTEILRSSMKLNETMRAAIAIKQRSYYAKFNNKEHIVTTLKNWVNTL